MLERAEKAIADDPYHRVRRRVRSDGAVVDFSVSGVLIAFEFRDIDTVEYIEFFLTQGR